MKHKANQISLTKAVFAIAGMAFVICCLKVDVSLATGFEAGRIMDDVVMANKSAMNVSQIQAFLNSKVPVCDNNGTRGTTKTSRRDYFISRGWPLPLKCLKEYTENGKSSAQIIYDTAQEFQINPQVLLVLLQKEQGLVTDDWPDPTQFRSATGYGCPDGAPCDSEYYGFTNQVRWAARMFRAILNNSPTWHTPYILGNNYIRYNPNVNCGGTTVNIQNRATQALYNYTPYQPNSAALTTKYGLGNSCSAYGNRNFYSYFTDWFGLTKLYVSLEEPRWMETKIDTKTINMATGLETGETIPAKSQFKLTSKIYSGGQWWLRSKENTDTNTENTIPLSKLQNIGYKKLSSPLYLQFKATGSKKYQPSMGTTKLTLKISTSTIITFTDEIIINGVRYLRTEYDSIRGNDLGILESDTKDITPISFVSPRYMKVINTANAVSADKRTPTEVSVPARSIYFFDKKITVSGKTYYFTSDIDSEGELLGINSKNAQNVPFTSLAGGAKKMDLATDCYKYTGYDLKKTNILIKLPKSISIVESMDIDDTYYRTKFDHDNNYNHVMPATCFVSA